MLDPKLLQKLRCPVSKSILLEDGDTLISTDADSRYRYIVKDVIPVLLKEEAEQLSKEAWTLLMHKLNHQKA